MFWKFGFHSASSIDSLLDEDDVSLEAILDEDDLLQECKSQNTRLIDYFQRVDVLRRLLAYVCYQIETEERGRFKYPYVAAEVLCSEIWSIVETCVNHADELLGPFWETVLDIPPEEMKTQMVMAAHFTKINTVFLSKKPAEMLAFIRSQPNVIERILSHIETPSFVDLLMRIIQLDEIPSGAGVLEWLSEENLMGRLIEMLSPSHSSDVHTVVADVIKGIISMAAPSPGAGLTEGLQNGPASNRFARELAHRSRLRKLAGYMVDEFNVTGNSPIHDGSESDPSLETRSSDYPTLPSLASATSSVIQSISVVVELIRKNNSDYFEPYLFHTIRNRLMDVQQHLQNVADGREELEQVMNEMVERMRVVHLGTVLEVMCDCMEAFQRYLRHPRSLDGPTPTTLGLMLPLTFERYRICELYAELLHCSNMSLLNRSAEFSHLYDDEGRLSGGLPALDELARVISIGSNQDLDALDQNTDEVEPALELPITAVSHDSPSLIDSDEDMSDDEPGSSDDEAMEEIALYDDAAPRSPGAAVLEETSLPPPPSIVPSSPNAASLPSPAEIAAQGAALRQHRKSSLSQGSSSDVSAAGSRLHGSRRNTRRATVTEPPEASLPIGEKLKQKFLQMNVLSTLLDLFFEFPWNNFLHSVVYDLIHQILNGRVDGGMNRRLITTLFCEARLMHRIVEGQKRNDTESAKPKGVRLGYMGHLTLISEDVIGALEHFPSELRHIIAKSAPQPDWDDYVNGRYVETKKRDASTLGGGKPVISIGVSRGAHRWKVDEEDALSSGSTRPDNDTVNLNGVHQLKGEFRTSTSNWPRNTADFGPSSIENEGDHDQEASQFGRYLGMQSSDHFGSGSDVSDEEDEDGGWLAQSTFDLGNPPVSARNRQSDRRSLSSSGFDDAFVPGRSSQTIVSVDPFGSSDDDEAFGPFSDSGAASGTEPFTFSSFSDEIEDSSFESFGEFGDYQTSGDRSLTPTGGSGSGSWTFASDDLSSSSEDLGFDKSAKEKTDGGYLAQFD